MGNRGSKSELKFNTVKEQRVDGSWFLAKIVRSLRYTLIEKKFLLYLTIYLTKLKQINNHAYF